MATTTRSKELTMLSRGITRFLLGFCSFLYVAIPAFADNWPMFRGPLAGVSENPGLPAEWDTKKNVAWAVDVPGRGWSSPIVWGDRIFLTSVVSDAPPPAPKPGLYIGGEQSKPPEAVHHWMVYCLDLKSGKVIWEREAAKASRRWASTRRTPTPPRRPSPTASVSTPTSAIRGCTATTSRANRSGRGSGIRW